MLVMHQDALKCDTSSRRNLDSFVHFSDRKIKQMKVIITVATYPKVPSPTFVKIS
jgi:hypothetical protein